MKKIMLMCLASLFSFGSLSGQIKEEKAIKKVITAFAEAGDNNDVKSMEKYLDKNYQVAMNRLFGSKEVSIVPRSVYLSKIKSKEWGGDTRTLSFLSIIVNGNTAVVHVKMKGDKSTFISLINLVQNEKGEWQLLSDLPIIE